MDSNNILASSESPAAFNLDSSKEDLLKEIERLHKLLFEEPELIKMTYTKEDGLKFDVDHWAIRHMVVSVADTLLDGRKPEDSNYFMITFAHPELGPLDVTIQKRWSSKTPFSTIEELKKEIQALKEKLGN